MSWGIICAFIHWVSCSPVFVFKISIFFFISITSKFFYFSLIYYFMFYSIFLMYFSSFWNSTLYFAFNFLKQIFLVAFIICRYIILLHIIIFLIITLYDWPQYFSVDHFCIKVLFLNFWKEALSMTSFLTSQSYLFLCVSCGVKNIAACFVRFPGYVPCIHFYLDLLSFISIVTIQLNVNFIPSSILREGPCPERGPLLVNFESSQGLSFLRTFRPYCRPLAFTCSLE